MTQFPILHYATHKIRVMQHYCARLLSCARITRMCINVWSSRLEFRRANLRFSHPPFCYVGILTKLANFFKSHPFTSKKSVTWLLCLIHFLLQTFTLCEADMLFLTLDNLYAYRVPVHNFHNYFHYSRPSAQKDVYSLLSKLPCGSPHFCIKKCSKAL